LEEWADQVLQLLHGHCHLVFEHKVVRWARGALNAIVRLEVEVSVVWVGDDTVHQRSRRVFSLPGMASCCLVGKKRVLCLFVTMTAVSLKSGARSCFNSSASLLNAALIPGSSFSMTSSYWLVETPSR
jgi:hypothetical protein